VQKRLELLAQAQVRSGAERKLVLRFLVSPTEITGQNGVESLKLVRNELTEKLSARATEQHEELKLGAVFRSIGYKGEPLADLPFDASSGTIPHQAGRVEGCPGLYVAGWIKRGPSGVIGTNKPCAKESAQSLLEDWQAGKLSAPSQPWPESWPGSFDFEAWKRLDQYEVECGSAQGRPRVKVVDRAEMLSRGIEPAVLH